MPSEELKRKNATESDSDSARTNACYRARLGDASWGSMLASFELPALAGNIVGGVVLVALINHGQAGSKSKAKSG